MKEWIHRDIWRGEGSPTLPHCLSSPTHFHSPYCFFLKCEQPAGAAPNDDSLLRTPALADKSVISAWTSARGQGLYL